MRKIGIMIGSDSDLVQCVKGLEYLKTAEKTKQCEVVAVITNSIHRNTLEVLKNLEKYKVDVWIIGAGCANHLTGTCDAYLRYTLRNDQTTIIGVAFEDKNNISNTEAAILSITQIPGKQIIFNNYVGEQGFLRACCIAVYSGFPEIKLKEPKPVKVRTLDEALKEASNKKKGS